MMHLAGEAESGDDASSFATASSGNSSFSTGFPKFLNGDTHLPRYPGRFEVPGVATGGYTSGGEVLPKRGYSGNDFDFDLNAGSPKQEPNGSPYQNHKSTQIPSGSQFESTSIQTETILPHQSSRRYGRKYRDNQASAGDAPSGDSSEGSDQWDIEENTPNIVIINHQTSPKKSRGPEPVETFRPKRSATSPYHLSDTSSNSARIINSTITQRVERYIEKLEEENRKLRSNLNEAHELDHERQHKIERKKRALEHEKRVLGREHARERAREEKRHTDQTMLERTMQEQHRRHAKRGQRVNPDHPEKTERNRPRIVLEARGRRRRISVDSESEKHMHNTSVPNENAKSNEQKYNKYKKGRYVSPEVTENVWNQPYEMSPGPLPPSSASQRPVSSYFDKQTPPAPSYSSPAYASHNTGQGFPLYDQGYTPASWPHAGVGYVSPPNPYYQYTGNHQDPRIQYPPSGYLLNTFSSTDPHFRPQNWSDPPPSGPHVSSVRDAPPYLSTAMPSQPPAQTVPNHTSSSPHQRSPTSSEYPNPKSSGSSVSSVHSVLRSLSPESQKPSPDLTEVHVPSFNPPPPEPSVVATSYASPPQPPLSSSSRLSPLHQLRSSLPPLSPPTPHPFLASPSSPSPSPPQSARSHPLSSPTSLPIRIPSLMPSEIGPSGQIMPFSPRSRSSTPFPPDTLRFGNQDPDRANYEIEGFIPEHGLSQRRNSQSWKRSVNRFPKRLANTMQNRVKVKGSSNAQRSSNYHVYEIPFGDQGEKLSINVRILRSGGSQFLQSNSTGHWLWPEVEPPNIQSSRSATRFLGISEAKRLFDNSKNHHTLDLTCYSRPERRHILGKNSIKWLHVERKNLNFDEFQTIVMSTPDLSQDWKLVLLSLLLEIKKIHRDRSTDRFYPWTLRADGSTLGLLDDGNMALSATSICLPYFSLKPISDRPDNHIMTLFEWDDRFESTKEWDSEQSIRVMSSTKEEDQDSVIHIPHIWTMSFSNTIITYGQASSQDLVDEKLINLINLDASKLCLPESVNVTDVRGRVYELSLDQCQTFFALKRSIMVHCFVKNQSEFETMDVFTHDNTLVNEENWVNHVHEPGSNVIKLKLRKKDSRHPIKIHASSTYTPASLSGMRNSTPSIDASYATLKTGVSENTTALNSVLGPGSSGNGTVVPHDYMIRNSETPGELSSNGSSKMIEPIEKEDTTGAKFSRQSMPNTAPGNTAAGGSKSNTVRFDLCHGSSSINLQPSSYCSVQEAEGNAPTEREDDLAYRDHSEELPGQSILPFLGWVGGQELVVDGTTQEATADNILKVLEIVHGRLLHSKRRLGHKRHKRTYQKSQMLQKLELENRFPSLRPYIGYWGYTGSKDDIADQADNALLKNTKLQDDIAHSTLLKACDTRLKKLYSLLNSFLSLYFPTDSQSTSNHPLVKRCWGAFGVIMTEITSGITHDPELPKSQPLMWFLRDLSIGNLLSNRRKPAVSWQECKACRDFVSYKTNREAALHILGAHFDSFSTVEEDMSEILKIWLRDTKQFCIDQRLEMYAQNLDLILNPLSEIYTKGESIWNGVASRQSSTTSQFMLTGSLLEAFENTVLLLLFSTEPFYAVAVYADLMVQKPKGSEDRIQEYTTAIGAAIEEISHFARRAKESMYKAEQDVMIRAYTDTETTETIRYDRVGPEYLLATILTNLSNSKINKDEEIDMVYASFYRRLQVDAMKHPRTRVLDRIWRMREELDVIIDVNMQQQELLRNYLRILDPGTFHTPTSVRIARFKVEAPYLQAQLQRAHAARLRLEDLDSRLEDVSTHVSRMLKVQQENNGNAIIVFTIVTIIFLPLSWVTSYLGMNTNDIRDVERGQWLYWVISLPVTGLVIGLAVLVVLKGEPIREFFIRRQIASERAASVGLTRRLTHGRTLTYDGMRRLSTIQASSEVKETAQKRVWWKGGRREKAEAAGSPV